MVRCSVPFDAVARKERLLAYYEYLSQGPRPTISIVQDVDSQPGLGAFWGEVNTNVHWGLGCVGAVTNGSMRDLDKRIQEMHAENERMRGDYNRLRQEAQEKIDKLMERIKELNQRLIGNGGRS